MSDSEFSPAQVATAEADQRRQERRARAREDLSIAWPLFAVVLVVIVAFLSCARIFEGPPPWKAVPSTNCPEPGSP